VVSSSVERIVIVWHEVDLRGIYIGERIIGFSVPVERQIAVISYEGIHVMNVDEPQTVLGDTTQPEGGNLYDRTRQTLTCAGTTFHMLGLFGGIPLLQNEHGEEVFLDPTEDVLQLRTAGRAITLTFRFEDLSGDWRYSTFSPDGNVLVLDMPYNLHIFLRVP
jgi:hypothetical protein